MEVIKKGMSNDLEGQADAGFRLLLLTVIPAAR
jgi:hypothetical protein